LLSLSSIELRASRHTRYQGEAQANARLALMLAIGELQRSLGPDQRISADSDLLDSDVETTKIDGVAQPSLLGVWDAWSPLYGKSPNQPAIDYHQEKKKRFRRWLVSHPDSEAVTQRDYALSAPVAGPLGVVEVYSEKDHGVSVLAPLIGHDGGMGAHAWHIRQENTKAQVISHAYAGNGPNLENVNLVAPEKVGYRQNANFADVDVTADVLAKVVSQAQLLLAKDMLDASFDASAVWPHFTTYAAGLHTDVVRGGLKQDLSLAFELPEYYHPMRLHIKHDRHWFLIRHYLRWCLHERLCSFFVQLAQYR